MRRILALGCVLALCFLGASALPAYAEETPPPVRSSPGDPFGGETIPPGPVFVITPGSPGSTLGESADPEDVQELIEKDRQQDAADPTGTPTASDPSSPPTGGVTDDDVPVEPAAGESVEETEEDDASTALWWSVGVGAAAVAALMTILLVGRRKRDRAASDSLKEHAS